MEISQYASLLDEATRASWTRTKEEGERLSLVRSKLLQQLAQEPTKTLPILLQALEQPDLYRQTTAIEIIDLIGSPENEVAKRIHEK
jgi:hypothetical protein